MMMVHNATVTRTRADHPHALAIRAKADAEGCDYGRAFARYIEEAKAGSDDLASVDNMHLLPLEELVAEFRRLGPMDEAGTKLMLRYERWLVAYHPTGAEGHLRDPGFQTWRRLMQVVANTCDTEPR